MPEDLTHDLDVDFGIDLFAGVTVPKRGGLITLAEIAAEGA